MTVETPRVIPRPSERRASIRVVHEPAPRMRAQDPDDPPVVVGTTGLGRATSVAVGWVAGLGAALAFGVLGLTGREDSTLGVIIVPVALLVAWMTIGRFVSPRHSSSNAQSRSNAQSQRFGALLFAGYGVRLLASVPRLVGGADSPVYQQEGLRIAESLRQFQFDVATGRTIPGTGAVRYFSGIVNVFTGSSYIATFLVFATLAFVGQVVFLLGVRSSLNDRQFGLLATVLMFSPTLAFWPSSIGKESLALFGIGLAVFGASRLFDRRWDGVGPVVLGLFSVGMVRPHVAMVLVAALLVGLFARRAHTRGRIATHAALLVVVVVGSMWMASASAELFGLESLDGISDVSAALDFAQDRTSQDEARFVAARVMSPADYPWAAITVLFRPFPWEAPNVLAMVSALESTFLGLLLLRAVPGFLSEGRQLIQRGQLLFAVAFVSVFIFLFSAIGNFGILSRQRAQVIPFVLLIAAFGVGVQRRDRTRQARS